MLSTSPTPLGGLWLPLATIAGVAIVNCWNLVDVMDGLAGSLAIIGALAWVVSAGPGAVPQASLPIVALLGGLPVFMRFNLPKAKLFMKHRLASWNLLGPAKPSFAMETSRASWMSPWESSLNVFVFIHHLIFRCFLSSRFPLVH